MERMCDNELDNIFFPFSNFCQIFIDENEKAKGPLSQGHSAVEACSGLSLPVPVEVV